MYCRVEGTTFVRRCPGFSMILRMQLMNSCFFGSGSFWDRSGTVQYFPYIWSGGGKKESTVFPMDGETARSPVLPVPQEYISSSELLSSLQTGLTG
jgi:hypothetical protein